MSTSTVPEARISAIIKRHSDIQAQMATGELAPERFVELSKEYAELEPIAAAAKDVLDQRQELAELESIAADSANDAEMRELAEAELDDMRESLPKAERRLAIFLLPKDVADERSAILEIRAGTGGEEAALFAADLYRMYQRYAEVQGWKVETMDMSGADAGGIKEVVVNVSGSGVFAKLKFESGVHRVQRVPATEASGRIHTSAATVAVLPEAEEVDVDIQESDLRVDIYRASGAGGQHVNTTDSAVRLTHIPTGIVVTQQDERSQHKNRAKAMKVLRARIFEVQREKLANERAGARKSMVGSGDRSERIRTYNFPQGRVTDHRINLTLHKLPQILEGDLDDLVGALIAEDEAERLAGLDTGAA